MATLLRLRNAAAATGVLSLTIAAAALGAGSSPTTTRVSVSSNGGQGNGGSEGPSISANGRFVAFASLASDLVAGDDNGVEDVFVRDRMTGKTKRVSVSSTGAQANGMSWGFPVSISNDGRYVAFESHADNLVSGDGNGSVDIFVRDTKLHKTRRVSVSQTGGDGDNQSFNPVISGDGGAVAFESDADNLVPNDTNGATDVFVRNLKTHTNTRVSVSSSGQGGNSFSERPSISTNGRLVAFHSDATNLVSGPTATREIFLHDLTTHETRLVSVGPNGVRGNGPSEAAARAGAGRGVPLQAPSISGDGRFVAFGSAATNLVGADTNNKVDVFLRDTKSHTTNRISVSSGGAQADGDSFSLLGEVSAHGELVVFLSEAHNLVPGDGNHVADAFLRDVANHKTRRLSVNAAGHGGNGDSIDPVISADGRTAVFSSDASNLVSGDSNHHSDIFVRGPLFP
jgi:Tol biopolymer transport system component